MLFVCLETSPGFGLLTRSAIHPLSARTPLESANIYFGNVHKVKAKANSFWCPTPNSWENIAPVPSLKRRSHVWVLLKSKWPDRCPFPPCQVPNSNIKLNGSSASFTLQVFHPLKPSLIHSTLFCRSRSVLFCSVNNFLFFLSVALFFFLFQK